MEDTVLFTNWNTITILLELFRVAFAARREADVPDGDRKM
jgi:hypothetical protein